MLREKNYMSSVKAGNISLVRMEVEEEVFYLPFDDGPEFPIEPRSKAIRSRTSILIHREERGGNLIVGEGGVKRS